MTVFDTQFAFGAAPDQLANFGESVTYYNRAGDPGRAITAIVERDPPRGIEEVPVRSISDIAIITVRNDATTGIASTEIDVGGDEIDFPRRIGETARRRGITSILSQRGGMLRLEVR